MATCTATVPDLNTSGDNLYGPRICWQAFIDWAWDAFDFDKDDWDQGFGYFSVCDNRLPAFSNDVRNLLPYLLVAELPTRIL